MKLSALISILKNDPDGLPLDQIIGLTVQKFRLSFAALLLCIPMFVLITKAVVKYNDNSTKAPYIDVIMVLALMSLSYPLIAYFLTMVFDKQASFKPWVTVRNWAFVWIVGLISAGFGLYLVGLLPFSFAYIFGLGLYLGTLALDIRLAHVLAGFDWAGSVFCAILISVTAIMVLLLGLTQILS